MEFIIELILDLLGVRRRRRVRLGRTSPLALVLILILLCICCGLAALFIFATPNNLLVTPTP